MNMSIRKLRFLMRTGNVYLRYKMNKPIPFLLVMVPSKECNLRCAYCEYYKNNDNIDTTQMSFDTMKRIIDQAHQVGIPFISFSGGEPLISEHIEAIAKHAYQKGILLNLNTNGTLITKERARKLVRYFDYIRVSLDGCGAKHDEVTGIKDSYQKVVDAISYLNKYKKQYRSACKIGINIVYDGKNEEEIAEVIDNFKSVTDMISILPRFSFVQDPDSGFVAASNRLLEIMKKNKDVSINCDFIKDSKNSSCDNNKRNCDFGKLYMTAYPRGWIMGCPFIIEEKGFVGDYKKDSLMTIVKRMKDVKKPDCIGCYATCTTHISKVFRTANIFSNLKYL